MGVSSAPELLTYQQDTSNFDCGTPSLNEWLKKRALKNQDNGASRSFVITCDESVVGYYALARGSVERSSTPKSLARNMPEPIPVMVLGRLAIDLNHQGQKLGAALLKDAMLRTLTVSTHVGVRAMLVHAISDDAKNFYLSYGFQESPIDAMTLFLSIKHLKSYLR